MAATCCWKLRFFSLSPNKISWSFPIFFFIYMACWFLFMQLFHLQNPMALLQALFTRHRLPGQGRTTRFLLETYSVWPQSPAYFHVCQLCCGSCDPWWIPDASETRAVAPCLWGAVCIRQAGTNPVAITLSPGLPSGPVSVVGSRDFKQENQNFPYLKRQLQCCFCSFCSLSLDFHVL